MRGLEQLAQWNYHARHRGTRMLEYAADFARAQGPDVSMTKCVYPAVGRAWNTSAQAAEANMRYAAKQAGDKRPVGEIVHDLMRRCDPD